MHRISESNNNLARFIYYTSYTYKSCSILLIGWYSLSLSLALLDI